MLDEHWLLPPDANSVEKEIALYSLLHVYEQFPDPVDKLIICQVFELNYPQYFVARTLNRTEKNISVRIKKIKLVLSKTHKKYLKPDLNSQNKIYEVT